MGLTANSTGFSASDNGLHIKKQSDSDIVVAVAGIPNVGKSTLFNAMTGMKQHTGNWTGKTVAAAHGSFCTELHRYILVDIPGTYSLLPHSAEEEVARDFICLGKPDLSVVVCDATSLVRGISLVIQVCEICPKTIVCVNLMDEAQRKGIDIDLDLIQKRLGVPVCGTNAHSKSAAAIVGQALDKARCGTFRPTMLRYTPAIEAAVAVTEPVLRRTLGHGVNARFLALRLLEGEIPLIEKAAAQRGLDEIPQEILAARERGLDMLAADGITADRLRDSLVGCISANADDICRGAIKHTKPSRFDSDRRADRILTSRRFGYPIMVALLLVIFWLTMCGANYPSQLLSYLLFALGDKLSGLISSLGAPEWLRSVIIDGAYKTLAWVLSVMLPPMAIFFPLFTLLEDSGYLPRIAYNLDKPFKNCSACGKQALTMCMGFGCNAAGIVGCRIIDSKRERLIAMLTNNFVPCNGRFPTIIAMISIFFAGAAGGFFGSVVSAVLLTAVILIGIGMTFFSSKLLSETILSGEPSSYTLELPPYRRPQFGKVIVRSIFDRTLYVLGRAAAVAAPAGVIIWLTANITVGGATLLSHCTAFLDPFAQLLGLDGVILMAFILGLPANEIVVPIIIMAYTAQGSIAELDLAAMKTLLTDNGWTWVTAGCMILFTLMHWPCSTSVLTIKKESGSLKWAALSMIIPTLAGMAACFLFNNIAGLFL
ncbi:MAG: ferrous iron transport protein B [Oscillospiraceae bacterium]